MDEDSAIQQEKHLDMPCSYVDQINISDEGLCNLLTDRTFVNTPIHFHAALQISRTDIPTVQRRYFIKKPKSKCMRRMFKWMV